MQAGKGVGTSVSRLWTGNVHLKQLFASRETITLHWVLQAGRIDLLTVIVVGVVIWEGTEGGEKGKKGNGGGGGGGVTTTIKGEKAPRSVAAPSWRRENINSNSIPSGTCEWGGDWMVQLQGHVVGEVTCKKYHCTL